MSKRRRLDAALMSFVNGRGPAVAADAAVFAVCAPVNFRVKLKTAAGNSLGHCSRGMASRGFHDIDRRQTLACMRRGREVLRELIRVPAGP